MGCNHGSILPNAGTWYPDSNNYSVGPPSYDSLGFTGYGAPGDGTGVNWALSVQRNFAQSLPCAASLTQTMVIDCPTYLGGDQSYQRNTLQFIVGDGTFTVSRNGEQATPIAFGTTRNTWIWSDYYFELTPATITFH